VVDDLAMRCAGQDATEAFHHVADAGHERPSDAASTLRVSHEHAQDLVAATSTALRAGPEDLLTAASMPGGGVWVLVGSLVFKPRPGWFRA